MENRWSWHIFSVRHAFASRFCSNNSSFSFCQTRNILWHTLYEMNSNTLLHMRRDFPFNLKWCTTNRKQEWIRFLPSSDVSYLLSIPNGPEINQRNVHFVDGLSLLGNYVLLEMHARFIRGKTCHNNKLDCCMALLYDF